MTTVALDGGTWTDLDRSRILVLDDDEDIEDLPDRLRPDDSDDDSSDSSDDDDEGKVKLAKKKKGKGKKSKKPRVEIEYEMEDSVPEREKLKA